MERLDENSRAQKTYAKDLEVLESRTMNYLKDIGLANSVQDLEGLVVRGRAFRSEVDVP